jgi:hypothetical protein
MKRMTRDDPQLGVLESLGRDRTTTGEKEAVDINFALGKAYDDIGEYERAFARFAEGNAQKRAGIVYDEAKTLARLQRISAAFTIDAMNAYRGFGDSTAAPIFIFGMSPRCFGARRDRRFRGGGDKCRRCGWRPLGAARDAFALGA